MKPRAELVSAEVPSARAMMATTARSRVRAPRLGSTLLLLAGYVVLLAGLAITVAPLLWMLLASVKPHSQIIANPLAFDLRQVTLENVTRVFEKTTLLRGFLNSALISGSHVAAELFFCSLGGFALAKYEFRGKDVIFRIMLATMMIPGLVMIVPLFLVIARLGLLNTYVGVILPGVVGAFGIFWMRQIIADVPNELLDAARIDGCGDFQIYRRIVVPVIVPGLTALGIFTFMGSYNNFLWPLIVLRSESMYTVQLVVANMSTATNTAWFDFWGMIIAGSTLASLPVVLLFLFFQRFFISGILAGSIKG
ncbi:MAG: carbohydrate ABC transporter permease [Chloroflexi bacterium]|nr:carbohydrate ABC transporter permease [Chloroflexota bacterium]